jgi:16S rRNA (cytosine1402-N4)-methyltransferase
MSSYHTPVLLKQCIEGLKIKPDGVYADLTYGGGGHSKEILKYLKQGKLIAFDQDTDALDNVTDDKRLIFVRHNFRYMKNFLKYLKVDKLDGVLADLGVSSHHFDKAERGFSFRFDGPLDMRMNKEKALSAKDVVNDYDGRSLCRLFYLYGELPQASRITEAIVQARKNKTINEVQELTAIISRFIPKNQEHKFLAKVFQAIRIEVNQEIEVLKDMLLQCEEVIETGGRLVVISYHSLEDKLVKNFIKTGTIDGELEKDIYGNCKVPFKAINNKPIVPDEEELKINNRARSAKLRIAEKL